METACSRRDGPTARVAGVVAQESGLLAHHQDGGHARRAGRRGPRPSPRRSVGAPPASMSPSRGPPATTTTKTPCSRPRRWSGVAACRMVVRKTPLTGSATPASPAQRRPATARRLAPSAPRSAGQHHHQAERRDGRPQRHHADQNTAGPAGARHPAGRRTGRPGTRPRRWPPAARPPSALPPPISTAPIAGSRARGWARTMAARSIRNVMRTLGRVPRNRKPSMHRMQAGLLHFFRRAASAAACNRPDGGGEGDDVDRVGPAEADPGHQHAGQQRADDHGQAERDHAQRSWPRAAVPGPTIARDDGTAGRLVDAAGRRVHGHQRVEQPDVAHSAARPAAAIATVETHSSTAENRATLRRSWASAIEPPYSPASTRGTSAKGPAAPRRSWTGSAGRPPG